MAEKPNVLAVDDDPTARLFIRQCLSSLAVDVHVAASCREFGDLLRRIPPDLCLIDVELPDGDGFLIAEALRRTTDSPVIFLSVHADGDHRLRALELGAIMYLAKPIHPRELLLRIRNILARLGHRRDDNGLASQAQQASSAVVRCFGGLNFDVLRRRLIDREGDLIILTASEFEVLALLTAEPHRVVTRQEIAERLGPKSAARYNARIVDILIWRLRKKLRSNSQFDQFIATVPSRGYMFAESVSQG